MYILVRHVQLERALRDKEVALENHERKNKKRNAADSLMKEVMQRMDKASNHDKLQAGAAFLHGKAPPKQAASVTPFNALPPTPAPCPPHPIPIATLIIIISPPPPHPPPHPNPNTNPHPHPPCLASTLIPSAPTLPCPALSPYPTLLLPLQCSPTPHTTLSTSSPPT